MSDDPLDLTVRELLGLLNVTGDQGVDFPDPVDVDHDHPGFQAVIEVFSHVHPATAATFLDHMVHGLDVGFTAQGGYHPDFQRGLRRQVRDPEDRFEQGNLLQKRGEDWGDPYGR